MAESVLTQEEGVCSYMCCVRDRWMLSKDGCYHYTSRIFAEGWLLSQELQSAIPCRCFLSLLSLSLPDVPPAPALASSSLICVIPRLKGKQVRLLPLIIFPSPIHMTKHNRSISAYLRHKWKKPGYLNLHGENQLPPEMEALYYYVWVRNIFYCVDTVRLEFTPQPVGCIS